MARNVPVICASDLTGGKFQINKKTGIISNPDASSFSKNILYMLNNLNNFNPKKFVNTIKDASNQIIKIMEEE